MEGPFTRTMILNDQATDHLFNNVKATIKNTKYSIGICALVDIYKGEEVFRPWEKVTGQYTLSVERARELHTNVLGTLLQYFDNDSYLERNFVNFKLVQGVNFIVAQPECLIIPEGEGGNLEAGTMKARWDILPNTTLSLYEPKNINHLL